MDTSDRPGLAAAMGLFCVALLAGCVPMPVHVTPGVSGLVLDQATGGPLAGAVVVVRFDARHGDLLPERALLGHREVVTDGAGRFEIGTGALPGLSAWPFIRTEARVVGVMRDGYRCGSPHGVPRSGQVTLRLAPALDDDDRRASCRPVAARPDETPAYLAAWRGLYPADGSSGRLVEAQRPLERLLEARRLFGPGENCRGPVVDLSLAPTGSRLAYTVEQEQGGPAEAEAGRATLRTIEVLELSPKPQRVARIPVPASVEPGPPRRLAWASGGELVLWDPTSALDRSLSPSLLSITGASPEVVWAGVSPPASHARGGSAAAHPVPVRQSDLNDESDSRWQGRSFRIERSLDPISGRARETLHVLTPSGDDAALSLPGEPCGPSGQYGRPHARISSDGRVGFDLRHVDGGCHTVAIDLQSGAWQRLDGVPASGVCNETRRMPLPQLRTALRGWMRDLEESLRAAGGDPGTSYTLHIETDGRTTVDAHTILGENVELVVSSFPVETPLRRIDVTAMGNTGRGPAEVPAPVLEPL